MVPQCSRHGMYSLSPLGRRLFRLARRINKAGELTARSGRTCWNKPPLMRGIALCLSCRLAHVTITTVVATPLYDITLASSGKQADAPLCLSNSIAAACRAHVASCLLPATSWAWAVNTLCAGTLTRRVRVARHYAPLRVSRTALARSPNLEPSTLVV